MIRIMFFTILLGSFSALAGTKLALWSEFVPYPELSRDLQSFREHELSLNLAWHAGTDDLDQLAVLLKEAETIGLEVRLWPLLPKKDGYWFNKWNAPSARELTLRLYDELAARGVKVRWMIFDLEPHQELVDRMQECFDRKNPAAFVKTLRKSSRDGSLFQAEKDYQAIVDELHSRGVKVMAVASNYILHDKGSRKLEAALGTPVSGVRWDEISFMVYRAEFHKFAGRVSPWIIEKYARRARKYFGENVSLAIGEAGFVPFPHPFQGYSDPADIHADIAAAGRRGVSRLQIYSWDGMRSEGVGHWLAGNQRLLNARPGMKSKVIMKLLDSIRPFLPRPH